MDETRESRGRAMKYHNRELVVQARAWGRQRSEKLAAGIRGSISLDLVIPDYAGNQMFNTLGNIAANSRAGLLFIDFESGRTLQRTGRAAIDWDAGRAAPLAGAERVLDFELDEGIDNPHGFPLRYEFHEYSHFNPS